MSLRKIKLTIIYDGYDYHGWQIQPGKKTIQGELENALRNLTDRKITVHGASRTDAGVSALGQAGLIQVDLPIPTQNFPRALTDKLPPDIAVTAAQEVSNDFDLFSAESKTYRYTIYTGKKRPVLYRRHCWHLPAQLDAPAMEKAAELLKGKKDFKSFASAADKRNDTVRTIFRCDLSVEDDWLYIYVQGDGFLYNMVRNIVGTLTEVGVGRIKPDKIAGIIRAKDRRAAGHLAPPQGLCLMEIRY